MNSQPDVKGDPRVGPEQPTRNETIRANEREPGRKRRWLAAVTAVFAVLAVVLAAFAIGRLRGDDGAGPGTATSPATTAHSTSSSQTSTSPSSSTSSSSVPPDHQPAPGVLDVTSLLTGPAPAIGYLQQGVVHLPDGTTVRPTTQYRPVGFTRLADDTTAYLTQRGSSMAVEIVTRDGLHHGPYRSRYEIVVNADHSLAAWLSPRGVPTAWQVGLTTPVTFPASVTGNSQRIAAVTGNDCTTPTGCRIYVSSWTGSRPLAWVVTPEGGVTRADALHRLVAVRDATESGLLVGYTRIGDADSTSALIDEADGHALLWQTSRHTLDSFSPQSRYLLAGPAYRDGIGDGQVAIYSIRGRLLAQRATSERHPGFLQGASWEDATHVVFTMYQAGHWSIVRIGVDGRLEYAVPPMAARWDHAPFQLEAMP